VTMPEDPYNAKINFGNKVKLNQKSKKEKPQDDKVDDVLELPGDGGEDPYETPILPTFELPGEGGIDPPNKPVKP